MTMSIKEKMTNFNKNANTFIKNNLLLLLIVLVVIFKSNFNINNAFRKINFTQSQDDAVVMYESATDGVASANYKMAAPRVNSSLMFSSANATTTDRKIAKTANLTIEVKNVEKVKIKLESEVNSFNGYVNNFNSYNYNDKIAYDFTIQVPAEKLDTFLASVKKLGFIKNESFSVQDKTELYNDNANRLKNLYSRRDSLRKMMETKSASLKDILDIDRELNNVQYEIERLEKNNQNIQKSVDYSTIRLTILPEVVIKNFTEVWKITKSIKNALNILILSCHKIIDIILICIAFCPFYVGTFIVYKVVKIKRKDK